MHLLCKGADLVFCTVVGDLAARILQIVFHIRALPLCVLHRLFQAASQRLCAELIQPAPKSPEHRLFDHYPVPGKERAQLLWVAHMNGLKAQAEEVVVREVVYAE